MMGILAMTAAIEDDGRGRVCHELIGIGLKMRVRYIGSVLAFVRRSV